MLMKVTIVYRPKSEHASVVEAFVHDMARQQNVQPELIDIDSKEGYAMLSLYDITNHPAILVTREDGQLVQHWAGGQLPLMQEVAAFAHN